MLVLPKKEERHLCSKFLAVLCITINVLWLHLQSLSSTEQYSQIYASPAEWLRRHLITRILSPEQQLPCMTPGTLMAFL